ncbi:MAG: VacB/RNase II family 3'-5' exoribonuclease [Clostridia bacterium]
MGLQEAILEYINKNAGVKVLFKDIVNEFGSQHDVAKAIARLKSKGDILITKSKDFVVNPKKLKLSKAKVVVLSNNVRICNSLDDGKDYFIKNNKSLDAFVGDLVYIKTFGDNNGAEIVSIIKKATNSEILGFVKETTNKEKYIVPKNRNYKIKIRVPDNQLGGANVEDAVMVTVHKVDQGDVYEGRVQSVLGEINTKEQLENAVFHEFNVKRVFPKEVLEECEKIPTEVTSQDIIGRRDLRNLNVFTIDPATALDFDDAISVEKIGENWRLGVHIADVSHYVKEGSRIYSEAMLRGTSVYFPNGVIPMLPSKLSNGVCSLLPNLDRLTLSVFMDINQQGDVIKNDICESVINSKSRMNYEEVMAIFNGDKIIAEKYNNVLPDLLESRNLAKALKGQAERRGELRLDISDIEVHADLGKFTNITISKDVQDESHELIERFMVICNSVVAGFMDSKGLPCVYRVHPEPDGIREFAKFMKLNFGIICPKEPSSFDLQNLIDKVPEKVRDIVCSKMLCALAKAIYLNHQLNGHYALALKHYCHFTAPIRRTPDLVVHATLKKFIRNTLDMVHCGAKEESKVFECAVESSEKERNADSVERALAKLFCCFDLESSIGKKFKGTVYNINEDEIQIKLENGIFGAIPIAELSGDYKLDLDRVALIGNKNSYKFGQTVDVTLIDVQPSTRQIFFKPTLQLKNSPKFEDDKKFEITS